jgi:hypothetical protein
VRLVDHVGGDGLEGVTVLAGVVGAEQQLTAAQELDLQVGLRSAAVAAVSCAQGCSASGNGSGHFGLISRIGVWSTYRPGATFPDSVLPDPSLKHVVSERPAGSHSSERHPWMSVPPSGKSAPLVRDPGMNPRIRSLIVLSS